MTQQPAIVARRVMSGWNPRNKTSRAGEHYGAYYISMIHRARYDIVNALHWEGRSRTRETGSNSSPWGGTSYQGDQSSQKGSYPHGAGCSRTPATAEGDASRAVAEGTRRPPEDSSAGWKEVLGDARGPSRPGRADPTADGGAGGGFGGRPGARATPLTGSPAPPPPPVGPPESHPQESSSLGPNAQHIDYA